MEVPSTARSAARGGAGTQRADGKKVRTEEAGLLAETPGSPRFEPVFVSVFFAGFGAWRENRFRLRPKDSLCARWSLWPVVLYYQRSSDGGSFGGFVAVRRRTSFRSRT